jgi:hypothetical protein
MTRRVLRVFAGTARRAQRLRSHSDWCGPNTIRAHGPMRRADWSVIAPLGGSGLAVAVLAAVYGLFGAFLLAAGVALAAVGVLVLLHRRAERSYVRSGRRDLDMVRLAEAERDALRQPAVGLRPADVSRVGVRRRPVAQGRSR